MSVYCVERWNDVLHTISIRTPLLMTDGIFAKLVCVPKATLQIKANMVPEYNINVKYGTVGFEFFGRAIGRNTPVAKSDSTMTGLSTVFTVKTKKVS